MWLVIKSLVVLLVVIEVGSRGVPEVKTKHSGPVLKEKAHVSAQIQSGGKIDIHNCKDCENADKSESSGPAKVARASKHDINQATRRPSKSDNRQEKTTAEELHISAVTKNTRRSGRRKQSNSKPSLFKPFLGFGRIRIKVNDKHVSDGILKQVASESKPESTKETTLNINDGISNNKYSGSSKHTIDKSDVKNNVNTHIKSIKTTKQAGNDRFKDKHVSDAVFKFTKEKTTKNNQGESKSNSNLESGEHNKAKINGNKKPKAVTDRALKKDYNASAEHDVNQKFKNQRQETILSKPAADTVNIATGTVTLKSTENKVARTHALLAKQNADKNTKDENKPASDRWFREGLNPVPDVDRLERILHPTVNAPVRDIRRSMENILHFIQSAIDRLEVDHKYIFNATRWNHMVSVREELQNLAEENDKIYDVVMDVSLLTKQIYRRAHERRHSRGRGIPVAAAAKYSSNPVAHISLHDIYRDTFHELRQTELLQRKISDRVRHRQHQYNEFIDLQRKVEEQLPVKALHDLSRRANQTIEVLETAASHRDMEDKVHLYGHMHNTNGANLRAARDLNRDANDILVLAKKEYMVCQKKGETIGNMLRERTRSKVSNSVFDENRMVLWATVDSAKYNADNLFKQAADIHMKLVPLIFNAEKVLTSKSHSSIQSKIDQAAVKVKDQLKTLVYVMDTIRVLLGEEHILQERCDTLEGSGGWSDDEDAVIDCTPFLTGEGSGEEIEGSGDIDGDAEKTDVAYSSFTSKSNDKVNTHLSNAGEKHEKESSKIVIMPDDDDDDDKDFIKKVTNKSKKTTTVAPVDETTLAPLDETTTDVNINVTGNEDTDNDFSFNDPFGWFSDDPSENDNSKKPTGHVSDTNNKLSLNELIRERLHNYSRDSKHIFENAEETKTQVDELSLTWDKVKKRADIMENKTLATKSFLNMWAAESASFRAVHDRVEGVARDVTFKLEVVESHSSKAIDEANTMLKQMEAAYKAEAKGADMAADPQDVKEAVETIAKVKNEVMEIVRLKQVVPDPCKTLQMYDTRIRTNISELRSKIEKAKLIASSLQVAVSTQGNGYLEIPLPQSRNEDQRQTSALEMTIMSSNEDGPIVAVKTDKFGSVVVSIEGMFPKLTVLDEDNYRLADNSSEASLKADTWYKLLLERLASTYSLTLYHMDASVPVIETKLYVEEVKPLQPEPDVVYISGLTDTYPTYGSGHWHGCFGNVVINGNQLTLLQNDTNGAIPKVCSRISNPKGTGSNMVLDGTGFVKYRFERLEPSQRLNSVSIQFTAHSDGVLMGLVAENTRMNIEAVVTNGKLAVNIHYYNFDTSMISSTDVYNSNQDLKITLEGRERASITLNGKSNVFQSTKFKSRFDRQQNNYVFIGGTGNANSSMKGCIQSFTINDKPAPTEYIDEMQGVHFGKCEEKRCVTFTEDSTAVQMSDLQLADRLHFTFTYGSMGPVLQYSKGKKFNLTVAIDSDGLDIIETVKDKSERIYLEDFKNGDDVFVSVKDADDEVSVTANGDTETISYGGGGWTGWGGEKKKDDDDDQTYAVYIGASSEMEVSFEGNLVNFFINESPVSFSSYLSTSSIKYCPPSPRVVTRAEPAKNQTRTLVC